MKRRDFIQLALTASPLLLGGCALLKTSGICPSCFPPPEPAPAPENTATSVGTTDSTPPGAAAEGTPSGLPAGGQDIAETQDLSPQEKLRMSEELIKSEQAKSIYFAQDFPGDIYFKGEQLALMQLMVKKLRRTQAHIGYGHFNLVGMDEFFRIAERSPDIGAITPVEKRFLEETFYFDAKKYGFNGAKVFTNFTHDLNKREVVKIAGSGHYLFKGQSLDVYNRIRKDIGTSLILTSGVRGTAKQFHLFFEKALQSNANVSKASRSLAPPGYSFHGGRDFDVGKVGYGFKNFTQDFARTEEYKRLLGFDYFNIRYTQSNLLGVRFEPWHVKVDI